MEVFKAVLIISVLYFINTTSAQYRLQESLSPQNIKIQRSQPFNVPVGISSLDFLSPTKIQHPKYETKKTPEKSSKISKRQYLAEVFKQSAINNLIAAAKSIKEPIGLPLSNKLTYPNNLVSDLKQWRL